MAARLDKSKMACNKPRKSPNPKKKRLLRLALEVKRRLFITSGYGHNYSAAARKSFKARHKCSEAKNKLLSLLGMQRPWAGKGGSTKSSPKSKKESTNES